MEEKIRLAVFGQKRLSREGGIEIVVKELCTRMAQKSRSFTILTMTCQRMIMWTLLLLLTACVSVESTKRYIWETTVIKLSKTSHGHVSSLFRILSKKSSVNITVRQSRQSGVARATCPD